MNTNGHRPHRALFVARSVVGSAFWLMLIASSAHGQWVVTDLSPMGAFNSQVLGADGAQQTGWAELGEGTRASLWSGTKASWIDLHPAVASVSQATSIGGGQQAGWVSIEGDAHASLWSGTAESWVDLHPVGSTLSRVFGLGNDLQTGVVGVDGMSHASLWSGSADSWIDLHPMSATGESIANATSGGQQVGSTFIEVSQQHASLWTGSASSWVDLNPVGSSLSEALAVRDGQQGGYALVGGFGRASLWTGTADSWIDLNPVGSVGSQVNAMGGGYQGGAALIGGVTRAGLWSGTAESWEDLHALLPSEYFFSFTTGISTDGTNLYVSGFGFNTESGHEEALLWTRPIPAPGASTLLAIGCVLGWQRRSRA